MKRRADGQKQRWRAERCDDAKHNKPKQAGNEKIEGFRIALSRVTGKGIDAA